MIITNPRGEKETFFRPISEGCQGSGEDNEYIRNKSAREQRKKMGGKEIGRENFGGVSNHDPRG